MPWLRIDDQAPFAPKPLALGNAAFGAMVRLAGYASAHRTNGWIPAEVVRLIASPRELRLLRTVRASGRAPVLHERGDDCSCLDAHQWPAEPGMWVHDYLDRNPSRSENDVHRAKRRELGDKELRLLVIKRDGNSCRYCGVVTSWNDHRSPQALEIDHVDPRLAAGLDNLVVACKSCNSSKKDCTPEAAGLALLPPPVVGSIPEGGWPKGTDPDSIDREPTGDPIADPFAVQPPIEPPITSPVEQRSPDRYRGPRTPSNSEPATGETAGTTTGGQAPGTGRGGWGPRSPEVPRAGDMGPAGRRPQVGPATTPRTALNRPTYQKSLTSNPPPPEGDPPP